MDFFQRLVPSVKQQCPIKLTKKHRLTLQRTLLSPRRKQSSSSSQFLKPVATTLESTFDRFIFLPNPPPTEPTHFTIKQNIVDNDREESKQEILQQKEARLLCKSNAELRRILEEKGLKRSGNKKQMILRPFGQEATKRRDIGKSTVSGTKWDRDGAGRTSWG